jgi:SAM-dependent MidA family methyltransferase
VNLRIRDWLQDIGAILEKGFVFTIDYGHPEEEYYSEDRNRGTLLCYYNHEFGEDPYKNIGDQDMTSHVNFSSVKRWGEETGLKTLGYCSQGTFLLAMGIDQEIAKLAATSDEYLFELGRIKKLFLPQGMGDSHKVLIQYKGEDLPKLQGFSIRNQLRFL